ncbi:hypothetical protein ACP4OV_024866 [Aristida adscensionis]
MIRAATVHARLLLSRSYARQAKAASSCPLVSRKPWLLGRGREGSINFRTSDHRKEDLSPDRFLIYGSMPFADVLVCFAGVLQIQRPYYQMDTRGPDKIKMLTTKGCHSSSENQELAKKSCAPCNSKDINPMSEDSAKKLLDQVNGWELATEGGILKLHRALKVKNFLKGLELFQLVAAIAEEEGHHPDLHLVGGLTDNDFILAAKINHLNLEGILSKKATVQKQL